MQEQGCTSAGFAAGMSLVAKQSASDAAAASCVEGEAVLSSVEQVHLSVSEGGTGTCKGAVVEVDFSGAMPAEVAAKASVLGTCNNRQWAVRWPQMLL